MAITPEGEVVHGHNEDWSSAVAEYVYFMSYEPTTGADFRPVAGLVYPGTILGFANTWNDKGLYFTENSLFPKESRGYGLGMMFVQRRALDRAGTLDELRDEVVVGKQALGYSLNCVSLREKRAMNIEVHEDASDVLVVETNVSHFNRYKHMRGIAEYDRPSTDHRQARADALPAARTAADVVARLSDTHDDTYPIYRANITMVSAVLDSSTGELVVWTNSRPASSAPTYKWNLLSWFATVGELSDQQLVGVGGGVAEPLVGPAGLAALV